MLSLTKNDIFHVHSFRCGHAEEVPDEEYVKKAIALGADSIWFTDHAPFPGDPFPYRMRYEELEEYLTTLSGLKSSYRDQIAIHIGLEIEYLPTYDKSGYYRELLSDSRIELLLLGQHFSEMENGSFTNRLTPEKRAKLEWRYSSQAISAGIETGYFPVVAHPDRIFRDRKRWTAVLNSLSLDMIEKAREHGVYLEKNMSSVRESTPEDRLYWKRFWDLTDETDRIVYGLDAHSLDWLEENFEMTKEM